MNSSRTFKDVKVDAAKGDVKTFVYFRFRGLNPVTIIIPLILLCSACGTAVDYSWLSADRIGVNAHLPEAGVLDKVEEAGIPWLRLSASWRLIHPAEDEYDWDALDECLSLVLDRGFQVLLTISETPEWANSSGAANDPPDDTGAWEDFMSLAAARYPEVDAWGIWNEPNGGNGEYFSGTPEEFRDDILLPGCRGVRAADPDAVIVAPGITVHTAWSGWMTGIFTPEVKEAVDVVTVHMYTTGDAEDLFWDYDHRDASLVDDIMPVETVLEELHLTDKPLWIEETGWSTGGDNSVSSRVQADNLEALIRGLETRPGIERVFWYDLVDDPASEEGSYNFGLLEDDLSEKPAFRVLKRILAL